MAVPTTEPVASTLKKVVVTLSCDETLSQAKEINGQKAAASGDSPKAAATPNNDGGLRDNNLYVKHFDAYMDDEMLHGLFKEFGTVVSCAVLRDHSGKSKQVGFVQMSTLEEAMEALSLCGKEMGGPKPLHVALAQHKQERQRKQQKSPDRPARSGSGSSGSVGGPRTPPRLAPAPARAPSTPVAGVPAPATYYSPTYADPSTMVPPMQAMVVPGSVAMMNGQPMQMVPVGGHYPQGMVAPGPMTRAHSAPVPSDYYPQGAWAGPAQGMWYPPAYPYAMGGWTMGWAPQPQMPMAPQPPPPQSPPPARHGPARIHARA